MNDLIQIIKVLDQDQIKDLNKHIDNLKLQKMKFLMIVMVQKLMML